ncbi:MAG: hypothetical protein DRP10_01365 [Candidatus Aenigmatarchaeota archaeon]|nr:MAG: hypothetical protein DRP10_01365 [Candidatus Aenigmarchaeota archaeon]
MENIDLTYKKQMIIKEITGYNPDGSDKILITGDGLDVIKQIGYILRKDYKSIAELSEDIEKLKSDLLGYNLFD